MAQEDDLTPKQRRFVQEYLVDLNGSAAAIRAGYSEKWADRIAHQLLEKTRVRQAIDRKLAEFAKKMESRILEELRIVGFSDLGDILDFTEDEPRLKAPREIPPEARRAIAAIKVKRFKTGPKWDRKTVEVLEFRFWDKLSALEKLAKILGLVKERHEHVGEGGGPIKTEGVVLILPAKQIPDGGLRAREVDKMAGDNGR